MSQKPNKKSSSSVKKEILQQLKLAKKELDRNDYDDCISICNDIIKNDKTIILAYLLKGKCLLEKKLITDASKCFNKAVNLEPENITCWKGLLNAKIKSPEFTDFFKDLTTYANLLKANRDPLTEIVNLIKEYVKILSLDFQPFHIFYLKQIIPGLSELGDLVGYQVDNPCVSLRTLIKIVSDAENNQIKKEIDSLKKTLPLNLSLPAKQKKFNEKKWPILSNSEIPEYYELLITLENNDEQRYKAQDAYLKYKYDILLSAPNNTEATKLVEDIKDVVDGLVLINCPSQLAWNLYFDWQDIKSFQDLELDKLVKYIDLFGKKGNSYGLIFYNFLLSDISPFEKSRVIDYLFPKKKSTNNEKEAKVKETGEVSDEADDSIENENDDNDNHNDNENENDGDVKKDPRYNIFDIEPQTIFTNMYTALRSMKFASFICCNIAIDFSIHLKDYGIALELINQSMKLLANNKFINLSNFKIQQSLNSGICYTYYEAPKNYNKALAFYDNVAHKDPNNLKVKIGKALILFETNRIQEASDIFHNLITELPDNTDVMEQYGWCQIKLFNYEEGRNYLQKALDILTDEKNTSSKTSNTMEIVSTLYYKIADSYYEEVEHLNNDIDAEKIKSLIKKSFKLLVSCLKISPNYVSAYTLSGLLYYNYFDDKDTALKWFSKAFQLDPSEIEAAYTLVEHYTSVNDWEMAEIICQGIVGNDTARRKLNSPSNKRDDNSWHYRVLGCAAMEFRDDSKAIEYFQSALRMNPTDYSSWVGLGEAYIFRGRYEASIKVFEHVIKLQSGFDKINNNLEITEEMKLNADWNIIMLLSISLSKVFQYDESVKLLINLLNRETEIDRSNILIVLSETLVLRCQSEIKTGAILKASNTLKDLFNYLFEVHTLGDKNNSCKLWKIIGDALMVSLLIQTVLPDLEIEKIKILFSSTLENSKNDELLSKLDFGNIDIDDLIAKKKYCILFHYFFTLSTMEGYLKNENSAKILRSSLIYNIAVSTVSWFGYSKSENLREMSVKLLKRAIELEGNSAEYWNSLGTISLTTNPRISQHCFIKALALEPKSPQYWFNLGLLYINASDFEIAKQCFSKTQSIEPASSLSWIGFAIIADYENESSVARNLFTHSYVLSNGIKPEQTLLYAISVLETVMNEAYDERNLESIQQLTSANYGMMNYLKVCPNDAYALDISITIIERLYAFDSGIKFSKQLCNILENEYEENTDEAILINYANAKCQLSRMYLSSKDYEKAYETCEEVASLLDIVEDLNMKVQKCMMSCFTVLGLSLYFQGKFAESLTEFKKLLDAFPENKRIVVIISQVLYESGGQEEIQAAMDELLNYIEGHDTSIIIALTIAAISIVENLQDYILAVKEVLNQLPLGDLIKDEHREVPHILKIVGQKIRQLKLDQENDRVDKIWQRNAFMFPGDCESWNNISTDVALELNINSRTLSALDVSEAYIKTGSIREIQRGILLCGGVSPEAVDSLCTLLKK